MKFPEINRRRVIGSLAVGGGLAAGGYLLSAKESGIPARRAISDVLSLDQEFAGRPPNIILINCDDLGYGDLGCYGSRAIKTPHIDAMASQGVRFTDFNACDSVCTPSRAGMLTGRYPKRMDLHTPLASNGLSAARKAYYMAPFVAGTIVGLTDYGFLRNAPALNEFEVTLGEALQRRGYQTAMVGKWHLGDFAVEPRHSPLNHGFMRFFGVPYSNDMHPFSLFRDRELIEESIGDISKLTGLYTDEAINIIEANKDKPFFLYLAHTFPHRPLAASERFKNKSAGGLYGDTVEEIDWNFGRLMDALKKNGLERTTLVLFTSDNGPWYDGSPGGLRGRKGQSFEGGFRVPLIARWDGTIPQGQICQSPSMNLDLFPTLLSVAGIKLPSDRVIDGVSIAEQLFNPDAQSAERDLYFHHQGDLECMRSGDWKYIRDTNHYVWPMPLNKRFGSMSSHTSGPLPMLFNLRSDPDESYNLADRYPDRVKELAARMAQWDEATGRNPLGLVKKS